MSEEEAINTLNKILEEWEKSQFLNDNINNNFIPIEKIKEMNNSIEEDIKRLEKFPKQTVLYGNTAYKKLKETNYLTIYQQAVVDNNGRWRDKIQDMIKELEEQDRKWAEELEEPYSNFKNVDRNLKRIKNQVDILEELLKEDKLYGR